MAAIPVDINSYEKVSFFHAEQAMSFGEDPEPLFDKDTEDPIFNLEVAVAIQGRWRRETQVIAIRVVYPKGKNPVQDLTGRELKITGLKATPRLAGMNKNILAVDYVAESVTAAGPAGRPDTKPTA